MKVNIRAVVATLCAMATLALAVDPNPPKVISPTTTPYGPALGIAPNSVDASPGNGILFAQPYMDGLQPRAIYSINSATGAVASVGPIPTAAGVTAENWVAIVPTPAGSGFTSDDKYATGVSSTNSANEAVYRNGSGTPFIDGLARCRSIRLL